MNAGKGHDKNAEQQTVPVMMMQQPIMDEDEINLLDLWRVLWRRKMIVLGTALAAVVMAVVYALLATPVYKAEAFLLPPTVQNVQGLNVQGLNVQGPEQAYDLFIRNLESRALRQHYFDTHKLADQLVPDRKPGADINRVFDGFNKALSVSRDKKNKARVHVSFEGSDAKLAAQWVNDIVTDANQVTVSTLSGDIVSKLESSKHDLREEIAAKRKFALTRKSDEIDRLTMVDKIAQDEIVRKIDTLRKSEEKKLSDQITRLEEALKIARQLEIIEPFVISNKTKASESAGSMSISMAQRPLYFHGVKALAAETDVLKQRKHDDAFIGQLRGLQEKLALLKVNSRVEALRQRKNDDPFIADLRDLQKKLSILEGIHMDPSRISAVQIDQAAEVPDQRIKPKRTLIVILGLFGGLMLGIFAAFFAESLANTRREQEM